MKIFPDVITTSYIISQVLGFVSLIILCVGYFLNKDKLLFTQILGNGINAVAYFLLLSFVGGIGSILCTIRCLIFYLYDKKNKKIPTNVFCLIILTFVACVCITWQGYYDIFLISCYLLFTISLMFKDELLIKILLVVALVLSIIYNVIIMNVFGYIRNGTELVSVIVAIVEILVKRKKMKHEWLFNLCSYSVLLQ